MKQTVYKSLISIKHFLDNPPEIARRARQCIIMGILCKLVYTTEKKKSKTPSKPGTTETTIDTAIKMRKYVLRLRQLETKCKQCFYLEQVYFHNRAKNRDSVL